MKKINKSAIKRKFEFRYHPEIFVTKNKKIIYIDHPAFVLFEENGNYIYITITHSSKVKHKLVLKLKRNPNPKDKKDAYWVLEIRSDKKESFGKKRKKWKIDLEDVMKIIEFYYKKNGSAIR